MTFTDSYSPKRQCTKCKLLKPLAGGTFVRYGKGFTCEQCKVPK